MSALPPTDALGSAHTVRLILGDQLNAAHPWWSDVDAGVVTVLVECRQETDYARHHIQKVLAFFLAMRGFSSARAEEGHRMHHVTIDQPDALRPMLDVVHDVDRGHRGHALRAPTSGRVAAGRFAAHGHGRLGR